MTTILVGPCPRCEEMLAIFCGHALPLRKDVMESNSVDQKSEHIIGVLTEFLEKRVAELLDEQEEDAKTRDETDDVAHEDSEPSDMPEEVEAEHEDRPSIPESEVEEFLTLDLPAIDNKDYFKAVFG